MIVRSNALPYLGVESVQYREIKVTSKGQITLPKSIRERLRISAGDYLQAELRGGELVLRPSPRQNERELLLAYAKKHSEERVNIEEIRRMFSGLPFSMAERVSHLREEEP
ncbi:MAG: AbrB/MazE/SpoVT family DNA-binding domain-containing protein [Bacillota bacterium]